MHPRSIKEYLLLSISSFGILAVTLFMFVRIYQQAWMNVMLDFVIIIVLSSLLYYVYKTRDTEKASIFLSIFTMLSVALLVWMKGVSQVYWEYPVIIASYYLLRINVALVFSALLMIVVGVLTFNQTSLVNFSTIIVTLVMANMFAYFSARNISEQHASLIKSERLGRLRNKTLELIVGSHKLPDVLEFIVNSVEQESTDVICSISLIDDSGKYLITGAAPNFPKAMIEQTNMLEVGPESFSCGAAAFYGKELWLKILVQIIVGHHWLS